MAQKVEIFYNEGGSEEFELADKFELIPGPAVMLQQAGTNEATVIPFSSIKKMRCATDENKVEVVGSKIILPNQGGYPA